MAVTSALWAAALAASGLHGLPAVVEAQAPTILHACHVPRTGRVYRIKTTETPAACVKPNHVSGYEFVQSIFLPVHGNTTISHALNCPSGKRALGGRYRIESGHDVVKTMWDTPIDGGLSWFRLTNSSAQAHSVSLYVLCAALAP